MFTGLIEEMGTITALDPSGEGALVQWRLRWSLKM